MAIKEVIFDDFNEKILNFHVFSVNKKNYDKHIPNKQKNNFLIFFFTSNTLYVSNPQGKILTKERFSLNITRVDFSTFDDGLELIF